MNRPPIVIWSYWLEVINPEIGAVLLDPVILEVA